MKPTNVCPTQLSCSHRPVECVIGRMNTVFFMAWIANRPHSINYIRIFRTGTALQEAEHIFRRQARHDNYRGVRRHICAARLTHSQTSPILKVLGRCNTGTATTGNSVVLYNAAIFKLAHYNEYTVKRFCKRSQ